MTADHPTHVRYQVVALATLMAVLLYLDRICLAFVEGFIREDLGLNKNQAGVLLSAFFWAYALAQVPSGWLSDRYGARAMLALYILSWSLFTGLMGAATSFAALLLFRFGCGLGQAGAYPTSASLISKWVPFSARGFASSIVSTGGRIGGFAAPVLTAYLILAFLPADTPSLLGEGDLLDVKALRERLEKPEPSEPFRLFVRDQVLPALQSRGSESDAAESARRLLNDIIRRRDLFQYVDVRSHALPPEAKELASIPYDELSGEQIQRRNRLLLEVAFPESIRKLYGRSWRPVLIVYGLAGLMVAAWFFWVVRNRPSEHARCNAAEVAVIEHGRPATAGTPHGRVAGLPWRALLTCRSLWLSSMSQFGTNFGWVFLITYLPRYLDEAHHVPVAERGWMTGMPIFIGMAGMLTGGWLTDRLTRALGLRWGRRLPMTATRFCAMAGFLACLLFDSPWAVTIALCVVAVSNDLGTSSIWAFCQDIGRQHVGSVLGWGNMWGNLGAAVSPLVLGWIIGQDRWGWCFVACAAAYLLAGLAALGVDATVPIRVPESAGVNDGATR